MMTEYNDAYHYDDYDNCDSYDRYDDRVRTRRRPGPGIAAVLSVLIPGLGQVYNGRILAGLVWFLATTIGYSAILIPGFLIHVLCVWCAYRDARFWPRY